MNISLGMAVQNSQLSVADSSLYVYEPLSFEPGMSLTLVARLLVAAMIFLLALLILGVMLIARRARRRQPFKGWAVTDSVNAESEKEDHGYKV